MVLSALPKLTKSILRTKDVSYTLYILHIRSVHGWNATCLQLGSWLRSGQQKLDCELRGQLTNILLPFEILKHARIN
jgi:hypothetical protein